MTVRNSRRRFLAFLGLMGAPAALWAASARAQATTPGVTCTVSVANQSAKVDYFRTFDVVNNTLSSDGSDALMTLVEGALSHEFAAGYDTTGLIQPGDGEFGGYGPTFTVDDPDGHAVTVCQFSMVLKAPKPPVSVTLEQIFSDTESYSTAAEVKPGVDANSFFINGTFDIQAKTLTADFYIRVIADTVPVAQFGFNFSSLNWAEFRDKADGQYAGRGGVTIDSTTGAVNVPGCTLSAGSPCFFTTATVGTLGLSDDCWELRSLRAFRDGPLAKTAGGRALAARYYAEAPRLVAGVNRRSDAAQVWLMAYWTHILPCAVMARLGLNGPAVAHYTGLFDRLENLAA